MEPGGHPRPRSAGDGGRRLRGTAWSLATAVLALIWGDAAMAGVTALSKRLVEGPWPVYWLVASTVVALGAYYLTGLPQIRRFEARRGESDALNGDSGVDNRRDQLAVRTLNNSGWMGLVTASIIGGPLVVGWYYGRKRDPRARSLTWVAAWILGLVWCGIYSGLFSWIGD